jgi:hypothetical protein
MSVHRFSLPSRTRFANRHKHRLPTQTRASLAQFMLKSSTPRISSEDLNINQRHGSREKDTVVNFGYRRTPYRAALVASGHR